jgi:signal transduction histidine kinase
VVDGLVTAALLLFMIVSIASKPASAGQHAANTLAYLLAVGLTVPYVAHRSHPVPALTLLLGTLLIYAAIGYAAFPGVGAFALLFAISLHSGRTLAFLAFVATAAVLVIATLLQPAGVVQTADAVSIALATLVAWLAGENLRQRRNRWAALRERNELLERDREERARQAVLAERLRIARELHDVVAHAMSVIAVQAGVGHHVAATQPMEAQRSLAAIETTSRQALTEMRRLLGVLRQDGQPLSEITPTPGLQDVTGLLNQVADGGLTARLQIHGTPVDIPPGVDLTAYRIVQEALTNAIKHGGPRADITLAYTAGAINVEVVNDAPQQARGPHLPTPGHGLTGMRERVAVFGGEFSANPRPGGGFRITARLPYGDSSPS